MARFGAGSLSHLLACTSQLLVHPLGELHLLLVNPLGESDAPSSGMPFSTLSGKSSVVCSSDCTTYIHVCLGVESLRVNGRPGPCSRYCSNHSQSIVTAGLPSAALITAFIPHRTSWSCAPVPWLDCRVRQRPLLARRMQRTHPLADLGVASKCRSAADLRRKNSPLGAPYWPH
jgi:hypothetical protein